MLKKEKKKAQDAAARLVCTGNGHDLASQNALRSPTMSLTGEGSTDIISAGRRGPTTQSVRRGPQLSIGKQEAFEIFKRDHEDCLTIEDNKALLKQRFAEAKALGEQVNEARNRVNDLKKQLEMRRIQRAAHGVTGNHTEEKEADPVEEDLRKQIEEEKKIYKSTFGRLKALRTEIEHLQLLLERAKVKLQKDFQDWWSQEASSLQALDSEATTRRQTEWPSQNLRPSSPATPGIGAPTLGTTVRDFLSRRDPQRDLSAPSALDLRSFVPRSSPTSTNAPAWLDEPRDGREAAFAPSSELRALSTAELSSSSIPLTGDQRTDADIMAFIRARQNLLNRTGPAQE